MRWATATLAASGRRGSEGLLGWAEVAALRGERTRAARLLGAAHALREEIGYIPSPLEQRQQARITTALDPTDGALVAAQSEGRALTLDDAVAYALAE